MSDEIIFGIHACKQFIERHRALVKQVLVQEGAASRRVLEALELNDSQVDLVDRKKLDELCQAGRHQGVALRVQAIAQKNEKQLGDFLDKLMHHKPAPLLLVLDNVTDPHNLGACLRSAAGAGVDAVILPKDKSATVNATVRKVAAGAVEVLDIFVVTNLARSLDKLKSAGVWILGTALDEQASSLYSSDLTGPLAIVVGSEGEGMRRLTRERCDFLCYLPMSEQMQSLNVSVATGICLFEARRQRGDF